jgi:hypothetical protein
MACHNSEAPSCPAGMATGRRSGILPLPQEVVAQIKSSTAIVSLHDVVLELIKNALDAKATRIEAMVDFTRGACSVEDDGLGIAPTDFRADGGLGKLYCSSPNLYNIAATDTTQTRPNITLKKLVLAAMALFLPRLPPCRS